MSDYIPWAKPDFWGNEKAYINDALDTTWISGGSYINKLEDNFKKILNKKFTIAVSNGTTAIHLAFLGLDIKAGDEIIIPGFCYLAAANVALLIGATPIFAEVDKNTWCLDPSDVEKKLTEKTKAIVAVHTYGNVCDMDSLLKIANEKRIPIIEDCAESLFSEYKEQQSGSFGKINTFSFQATKTITTGEGGMVVTDDQEIAKKMMLYRSHGMDRSKMTYWHQLPGHNFRLTNLQAALGVAQLEKSKQIIKERERVYQTYLKFLKNEESIVFQKITKGVNPLIWALAFILDKKYFPGGRDFVMTSLKEKGIETRPGFFSSTVLGIYENHSLPVCEYVSKNTMSVPSFPTLTDEQIKFICKELIKLKKN